MNNFLPHLNCLQIAVSCCAMVFASFSFGADDQPAKKAEKSPIVAKSPDELGKNLFEFLKSKDDKYALVCTYDLVKDRLDKEKVPDEVKKREAVRMNLWNIGFALWNYEQKLDAEKQGYDFRKADLIEVKSAKINTEDGRKASESIEIRLRFKDRNDQELTLTPGAAEEIDGGWYFTPRAKDSNKDPHKTK